MNSIIKIENITKKYNEKIIFENFNLNIERGGITVITGNSGSGKTTLLNMIGLLDSPNTGKIAIENKIVSKIGSNHNQNIIAKHISYLFQNNALIEDKSILDNLLLALKNVKVKKEEKIALINNALKSVFIKHDLNTKIFTLSGGEQQRVAIARSLIKPSSIILADEPTGNLDNNNRDIILNIFEKINKSTNKTIIIVTHDLEVSKIATRRINLKSE
ncbi:ATP-binding cassette domain-containing protein [Mycoplasma sp. P36-A1]|uniref:ATP-binding cassette domain-containing protein n=1 Tax=Mycoplasma sp. P36-A1 TaxID=3252900 RepID=UPI003C2CD018